MKKYRVSLALLVPQNFEVEVEAESPKEALQKGDEIYNSSDWDKHGAYIDEEYVGKAEANYDPDMLIEDGKFEDPDEVSGVFVEEIKK